MFPCTLVSIRVTDLFYNLLHILNFLKSNRTGGGFFITAPQIKVLAKLVVSVLHRTHPDCNSRATVLLVATTEPSKH